MSPAGFSAVAQVKSLAVTYSVQPAPLLTSIQMESLPLASSTLQSGDQVDAQFTSKAQAAVLADFGTCNIGQTKTLMLIVQNQTPLAASVTLWLGTFQAEPLSTTASADFAALSAAGNAQAKPAFDSTAASRSARMADHGTDGMVTLGGAGLGSSIGWEHSRRSGTGSAATHKRKHSLVRLRFTLYSYIPHHISAALHHIFSFPAQQS